MFNCKGDLAIYRETRGACSKIPNRHLKNFSKPVEDHPRYRISSSDHPHENKPWSFRPFGFGVPQPRSLRGGQQRITKLSANKPLIYSTHGTDPPKVHQSGLGGGLKYFLFSHRSLGKWSKLTSIFFNWVETTNQRRFFSSKRIPTKPGIRWTANFSGLLSCAAWP